MSIMFGPVALWMGRHDIRTFMKERYYKRLFLAAFFFAVMIISHVLAISRANVAYMMSLKRMSIIIGVLYGYVIFRERNIQERLLGTCLMVIGFFLIISA